MLTEVDTPPTEFRDPDEMLVLLYHGGYLVVVIDGADLNDADPPVWLLEENGLLRRYWPKTTDWCAGICNEVKSLADTVTAHRAQNQPEPSWAHYFR